MFHSALGAEKQRLHGVALPQIQHLLGDQTVEPGQSIRSGDGNEGVVVVFDNCCAEGNISLHPQEITGRLRGPRLLGMSRIHVAIAGPYKGFATQ